jgi:hypothetical protein
VEHVVFFPAPDGAPVFRRVPTLEEAVRLVEHLRNAEGVAEVAVHPLGAEVPLAFRAYYRVEVPVAPEPVAAAPEVAPAPEPVDLAPVHVPSLEALVPEQPLRLEQPAVEQPAPAHEPFEQPVFEQQPVFGEALGFEEAFGLEQALAPEPVTEPEPDLHAAPEPAAEAVPTPDDASPGPLRERDRSGVKSLGFFT